MAEPHDEAPAIPSAAGQNAGHAQEPKKKGALENLISELGDFAKKSLIIGSVAAMPFLYNYINPDHVKYAAVTTGGFASAKIATNIIQE